MPSSTHSSARKHTVRKPRQARSQRTRAAILKAAAQLLGQRGHAEVSTNDIAKRAGVSIGSLYEYFPDRQAIVRELVAAHLSSAEQLFAARAPATMAGARTRPLRALLAELVETMLQFHADDPKAHRILSSQARLSRAERTRVAQIENGAIAWLTALLAVNAEVRIRPRELAARMVVATVDALTHRWILEPSGEPIPIERLSAELTDMLLAYLTLER